MIKKSILFFLGLILLLTLSSTIKAQEADSITDWHIKDFYSEITVNKDSSLDITEKITADCGNLPGKHGIFRVLPTQVYKSKSETIKTPISLLSITDFNNIPILYTESKDFWNHTLIWKIGDPNKEVTGVNYYQIKYRVQNAIR